MGVNQTIDITSEQHKTVLELLRQHLPGTDAWVYGSRAKWNARPQSDLDLVVFATPEQRRQVRALGEAFEESNLPFRVDLFVWSEMPRSFRPQIEAEHVVLERNNTRSRPASHLSIAQKTHILRDLICYTRDGEWGEGAPHDDLLPMRVVRGTDFYSVRNGSVAEVPTRYIRRDVAVKKTLRPWDILIETAGGSKNRSTGRTLLVHPRILKDSDNPVTCASFARIVRIDPTLAHPPYVYWYLQHLYSLGEMEKHQVQHTGVARFQFTRFAASIEIPLPSFPEQQAIAHVVGTVDDKIELNRRMNATLESMARALFKSWFIDFDPVRAKVEGRDIDLPPHIKEIAYLCPDSLVGSETGGRPKGWNNGSLHDVAVLNPESWSEKQHPEHMSYIDLANTKWGYIRGMRALPWSDAPSRARRVLRRRDTIIGTVRPGNGSFALIDEDGLTGSTGFAVLRPREPVDRAVVWCAATSAENIARLTQIADGGAYPAVRPEEVMSMPIAVADCATREAFARFVDPLLDRVAVNKRECRHLSAVRDELLPVLVSGKLRRSAEKDL